MSHLLIHIFLDGISIAAVNPVQLKAEVDVVPHVVLLLNMVLKALHIHMQEEGRYTRQCLKIYMIR